MWLKQFDPEIETRFRLEYAARSIPFVRFSLPIAGALNPRNSMFAAASMLSVVPPLVFAAIFQRYITGLNIVDPVTVGQD